MEADDDELRSFRAKHLSVAAAIEACERPDWALRLAFEATTNKKAVIRYASNMIPLLTNQGFVLPLITPFPAIRESIDVYADNVGRVSRVNAHGRAAFLGICLAVVLAYLIDRSGVINGHVFRPALLILWPLLAVVIRVMFAWIVRARAARLDDESAFRILLARVSRARHERPGDAYSAWLLSRRNLIGLLNE